MGRSKIDDNQKHWGKRLSEQYDIEVSNGRNQRKAKELANWHVMREYERTEKPFHDGDGNEAVKAEKAWKKRMLSYVREYRAQNGLSKW